PPNAQIPEIQVLRDPANSVVNSDSNSLLLQGPSVPATSVTFQITAKAGALQMPVVCSFDLYSSGLTDGSCRWIQTDGMIDGIEADIESEDPGKVPIVDAQGTNFVMSTLFFVLQE